MLQKHPPKTPRSPRPRQKRSRCPKTTGTPETLKNMAGTASHLWGQGLALVHALDVGPQPDELVLSGPLYENLKTGDRSFICPSSSNVVLRAEMPGTMLLAALQGVHDTMKYLHRDCLCHVPLSSDRSFSAVSGREKKRQGLWKDIAGNYTTRAPHPKKYTNINTNRIPEKNKDHAVLIVS